MSENRIDASFVRVASRKGPGLIPFLTVGFPDVQATLELVPALVEAGADVVELGVPFSDPLADGLTIQAASFHALQQGVTLGRCLEVIRSLRAQQVQVPLVLMGYYNPLMAFRLEHFAQEAAQAEVDGVIAADLPVEEAGPLQKALDARNIYLIPLLAPTSTEQRIQQACAQARGFIYCVSLTGVTGARDELPSGVSRLVQRVRQHTQLPLAVGFGISRREHVEAIGTYADAAVVGSALLRILQEAPRTEATRRVREYLLYLKGGAT
ncbi:MAG: tryptophan synthase subunit alpha [Dehalococcoidia bacterium]